MNNWAKQHWEDLCCEFSRLLKTEVLSCWQHRGDFQFLETECRFWPCAGSMLGPDGPIVQPELLSRLEIWDVPTSGTSGHRWQVRPGFATLHCQPALPLRGKGSAAVALSVLCSGLSQCQPAWWVWAQGSVPYEYSRAHLINALF